MKLRPDLLCDDSPEWLEVFQLTTRHGSPDSCTRFQGRRLRWSAGAPGYTLTQRLPPLRYCPNFLLSHGGSPAIVAFLSVGGSASRALMTFSRET